METTSTPRPEPPRRTVGGSRLALMSPLARQVDDTLGADEPAPDGHRHGVGLILHSQLSEDALLVVLDGLVSDGQAARDLPRRPAGAHVAENVELPGRQRPPLLGTRSGNAYARHRRETRRLPDRGHQQHDAPAER